MLETPVVLRRRRTAVLASAFAIAVASVPLAAQNDQGRRPPIIDIHVHTLGGFPGGAPMCPWPPQFLASDPKAGPEATLGWSKQDCALPLQPSKSPAEYMRDVVAEFERLNVTAVVMGDPETVRKWKAAAPSRVIMGTSFMNAPTAGEYVPVEQLRTLFSTGGFQVMGEIGLQYQGLSPSDTSVDRYFALAEQLDIPVAIHMGTGGSGRANVAMPKFRGSMGDPLLLEDLLARHPRLRLWIMHAGYPMIDNLLTLLQANSHVYVDVAGLIWSYPRKEVDDYIRRIVEGGFGDRLMFGTDQLVWPKLMETSIEVIDRANYLTPQQKRDILYNNAARFLRLDQRGGAAGSTPPPR
ncbi:MAG TPA: amidohydrolase family protein [Gemmatimonadaceae bacterium]|nr:amidohydrolase family protein [Gemmatimonadaceae bacterium]